MAKLPVILGNLDVTVDNVAPDLISKAFLNVSLHQTHIFNVWIVSGHLPAASH